MLWDWKRETGKQYIKTGRHHTETECVCCAAKIQALEERLCHSELTVLYLTQQLRYALHHFVKKTSRAMILQNLPNIGMRSLFLHIAQKG